MTPGEGGPARPAAESTLGGYEPEPELDEPLPSGGYRTYEVYQRERVGESTNLISPRDLISPAYLREPYALVATLRENYPCYRDWVGNRFWITRYDDVTSVFVDDANFEPRPKMRAYRDAPAGSDLGVEPAIRQAWTQRVDEALADVVATALDDLAASTHPDLATGFAARLPLELLGRALDIDREDLAWLSVRYWRAQRGANWHEPDRVAGIGALEELTVFFDRLLAARRAEPGDDVVSAAASLDASGADLAVTLLETDHETLHGSLANLWFLLLTHPEEMDLVRAQPRLAKFAYLEALRHSPPVLSAMRFARHEVERFGRLLPAGALLQLSAAAANRDPRQFDDPDAFLVERNDLCQREPRGQFRADGLPAGIAFGHGPPSRLPALPRDQPRSIYALTRDVAVHATQAVLERWPAVRLADGAAPELRSLRLGEMHTCWGLPVVLTTG